MHNSRKRKIKQPELTPEQKTEKRRAAQIGKKRSPEFCKKMSLVNRESQQKAIILTKPSTEEYIEFSSITKAAEYFASETAKSTSIAANICRALKYPTRKVYGYFIKYKTP